MTKKFSHEMKWHRISWLIIGVVILAFFCIASYFYFGEIPNCKRQTAINSTYFEYSHINGGCTFNTDGWIPVTYS